LAVGVKQGDNLAPILFLFMIEATMEIIEMEFKNGQISIPKFIWNPVSDTLKTPASKDTLNQQIFEYNRSLYANNSAILFESCMDLVNSSK